MAYTETYKVEFKNEQSQTVVATIYHKDGPVVTVQNYMAVNVELNDRAEGQTKYDSTIINRELTLTLWTENAQDITWETFITAEHDEWKVIVMVDNDYYFHGFITPDEGNSPFQDKPYEVTLRATNGLALLKDVDLVDLDGDKFTGINRLIDYIAAALKQTGLDLPIRTYCNYYNTSFSNRLFGTSNEMFNQAYLEYRTFLKTAMDFVSCYDALMIILDKFCRLEYWNGYWVIKNIAELQYYPGNNYYVNYTSAGAVVSSSQDTHNQNQIGKAVDLYPINEDQQIYSRFGIKSAKTVYNYTPWPEIPKNNKFDRGAVFETGTAYDEVTGDPIGTYKKFTIDDWDQGIIDYFDLPNPAMVSTSSKFWRHCVYNDFGIEIDRFIKSDTDNNDGNHAFWLRCQAMEVNKGDKISIGVSKKFQSDFSDSSSSVFTLVAAVYLVVGSDVYRLNNSVSGLDTNKGIWIKSVNLGDSLRITFAAKQKTNEYGTISVTSEPIPFDGTLYIAFESDGPSSNTGDFQYLKDFTFEYFPFVSGGYLQVKGDYWLRSQNKNFPDTADETVKISDSPKKMLQGALLKADGTLTDSNWYRYGATGSFPANNPLSESRQFKELLNIARFNHSYRRMYALDGSFNGLNSSAENDQLHKAPISFFNRYRLVDMTDPREFVFVTPLKMDLIKGWINANLVEVRKVTDGITDGTQTGDSSSFQYQFE